MRFKNRIAPVKYTATCLRKIHGTSPMANSNFATSVKPMANGNFVTSVKPHCVR